MKKGQDGFTLMEVLISVAILVLGMLTLALMQITAINGNASSQSITEATTLIESKIEELMNVDYNNAQLSEGNYGEMNNGYTISWDISDDIEIAFTKTVTVSVTWNDGGKQRSFAIQNVKGRI